MATKRGATPHGDRITYYPVYKDYGDAWLSIPMSLFRSVDVGGRISADSRMTPTRIYLNRRWDMGIFLDAAREAGMDIRTRIKATDGESEIRRMASYHPLWVDLPLETGQIVVTRNGRVLELGTEQSDGFYAAPADGIYDQPRWLPNHRVLIELDAEATFERRNSLVIHEPRVGHGRDL